MTEYAVLLPGVEAHWEAATDEQRTETYARHTDFVRLLAERGHKMTGGAELTPSRDARVVRREDGRTVVTDGPYAESAEQLTGFYLVSTDDLDDLLELCGLLADAEGVVEVRATVESPA